MGELVVCHTQAGCGDTGKHWTHGVFTLWSVYVCTLGPARNRRQQICSEIQKKI